MFKFLGVFFVLASRLLLSRNWFLPFELSRALNLVSLDFLLRPPETLLVFSLNYASDSRGFSATLGSASRHHLLCVWRRHLGGQCRRLSKLKMKGTLLQAGRPPASRSWWAGSGTVLRPRRWGTVHSVLLSHSQYKPVFLNLWSYLRGPVLQ